MPNVNSPRYQQWFTQMQTTLLAFNNSTGTWTNTSAQLQRVDENSVSIDRNAPYSRFPVLTGTKSEVAGIRGRKLSAWSIRGMPVIPSGSAGTVPDMDHFLRNIFGQTATISAGVSATYSFSDAGYLPFSLFGFVKGFATLTNRAIWACFVSRATFNFNGPFMTVDLDGFSGYDIDSTGFSVFDSQAKAGLTTFPSIPSSPTITGQPIQGFGNGYTLAIHSQNFELLARALSITIETGFAPIANVYGSAYLVNVVGGARRITIALGDLLDDDSAALNDLKTQADTDTTGATTCNAVVVAGNVAGSKVTFNVNNIQAEAFQLRDNGPAVAVEIPASAAHASTVGTVDDFTMVFT